MEVRNKFVAMLSATVLRLATCYNINATLFFFVKLKTLRSGT